MERLDIRELSDSIPFGARVKGLTPDMLDDESVRGRLNQLFEERGLIVFEAMEPSMQMLTTVSKVFGPLREHSFKGVRTVEGDVPGVMELTGRPGDADVFEVDGEELSGWVPWHFDSSYNRELNRAGVLRAVDIPPVGGVTGFADGIQLYGAISPELRDRFETLEILYHGKLMFGNLRYGRPRRLVVHNLSARTNNAIRINAASTRSIHPAIWQRGTGEKVLHLSCWQADGIFGHEDAEGDALLEAMLAEIEAKMTPYFHHWRADDMIIWDNWRCLHKACGYPPGYSRTVHRTTIEGDYGLGRWETEPTADQDSSAAMA